MITHHSAQSFNGVSDIPSVFSMSFAVMNYLALKTEYVLEDLLRQGTLQGQLLPNIQEGPDLSFAIHCQRETGIDGHGLTVFADEVSKVRQVVGSWLENLGENSPIYQKVGSLHRATARLTDIIEGTVKLVTAQKLVSAVAYSSKTVPTHVAADLYDVLSAIDSPIDMVCFEYSELMGRVVDLLVRRIDDDKSISMHEQESMVRKFADPIDEARVNLLSNTILMHEKLRLCGNRILNKIVQ